MTQLKNQTPLGCSSAGGVGGTVSANVIVPPLKSTGRYGSHHVKYVT
jgi:hypothetical protein